MFKSPQCGWVGKEILVLIMADAPLPLGYQEELLSLRQKLV